MKRPLLFAALGGAIALIALATTSQDLRAGCTACLPAGETSSHLAAGDSCAEADQKAIEAAMAEVPGWACATQPVEVTECYFTIGGPLRFLAEWKVEYSLPENICQ